MNVEGTPSDILCRVVHVDRFPAPPSQLRSLNVQLGCLLSWKLGGYAILYGYCHRL